MNIYTIGFAGKTAELFFTSLQANKIERLIDIRLNNKSQLSGFANAKHLPYLLKLHGIEYVYRPDFAPSKQLLDGYKKGRVLWEEYEQEYRNILDKRDVARTTNRDLFDNAALLCAEPTAEKCHRRLLAEYLFYSKPDMNIIHL